MENIFIVMFIFNVWFWFYFRYKVIKVGIFLMFVFFYSRGLSLDIIFWKGMGELGLIVIF